MKNKKVYVIWWWEYDMSSPLAVIDVDKLDDYIEFYKNKIIENHNNNNWYHRKKPEIKKIDVDKREDQVVFSIHYNNEWVWETYHPVNPYQNLTLEEMIEKEFGVRHETFEYTLFEKNKF